MCCKFVSPKKLQHFMNVVNSCILFDFVSQSKERELKDGVDANNLRLQLEQLNERARWYGQQFWQVSVSYFATSMISLATREKLSLSFGNCLLLVTIFGIFVTWHLVMIQRNWAYNVDTLIFVEEKLNLPKTRRTNDSPHYIPLLILVEISVAVAMFIFFSRNFGRLIAIVVFVGVVGVIIVLITRCHVWHCGRERT